MKFNKEWHALHCMPKKPSLDQRIKWHSEHQKNCNCRPFPEKLKVEMKKRNFTIEKE